MSDVSMILRRIGATLTTEVSPKLEGDYSAGHAGMAGLLAGMAADLWDRQADLLVNEIKAMRALLEAGNVTVKAGEPASFKVSDLTTVRNELAEQLIALQARLEQADDEASKALNTQIWAHLLTTCAARMPSPPQFNEA